MNIILEGYMVFYTVRVPIDQSTSLLINEAMRSLLNKQTEFNSIVQI